MRRAWSGVVASWLLLVLTGVGRGVWVQQRLLADDLAHDRAVGARLLALGGGQ